MTYPCVILDAVKANVDEPQFVERHLTRGGGLIIRVGHPEPKKESVYLK